MSTGRPGERLRRRPTLWDAVLVLLLAAASLLPAAAALGPREQARRLEVVAGAGPPRFVDLGREGRRRFEGILGESVAEVSRGRVRMLSSPCPDQLCVREGWKDATGEAIICAPNAVGLFLRGPGGEGPDAVTR